VTDAAPSSQDARTLLREHGAGWLGAVARRRSRRAYDPVSVQGRQLETLLEVIATWQPYADARVVFVRNPAVDVFTGVIGSYGKVTNAPHVLVFIADDRSAFAPQHLGYTGEAIVLEATRLELATCWVGGFFNQKRVDQIVELERGERVLAVSPVGYARPHDTPAERTLAGFVGAGHRKSVADLTPKATRGKWPTWAVAAVETARLAPSASNRQPWRFRFEDGGLVVAKDSVLETPKVAKRLDIGIAMLHVDLAAEAHGIDGVWTDLKGLDVARFDPVGPARP